MLYEALLVIVGLFFNFTIVKMKEPNKTLNVNYLCFIYYCFKEEAISRSLLSDSLPLNVMNMNFKQKR